MFLHSVHTARAFAAGALWLPLLAFAHAGTGGGGHHGFAAGLAHPFTGLDHLLAMAAVGFWSAATARRSDWRDFVSAPLSFATLLLVGALLARGSTALPATEPMIATSVLALGVLIAWRVGLPLLSGAALVGAFALFHGAAHGQELGGAAALAGMLLATVLLHAAGLAAGLRLRRAPVAWMRTIGVVLTAIGGGMLVA